MVALVQFRVPTARTRLHNFYITLYNNSISLEPLKVRDGARRSASLSVNNIARVLQSHLRIRALTAAVSPSY